MSSWIWLFVMDNETHGHFEVEAMKGRVVLLLLSLWRCMIWEDEREGNRRLHFKCVQPFIIYIQHFYRPPINKSMLSAYLCPSIAMLSYPTLFFLCTMLPLTRYKLCWLVWRFDGKITKSILWAHDISKKFLHVMNSWPSRPRLWNVSLTRDFLQRRQKRTSG